MLISLFLVLNLFGIKTSSGQQTEHIWVDSDSVGIGNVQTWNSTIFYPDVFRFVQPGTNFDIQEYHHPIYEDVIALVVRANTQFSFEAIVMGDKCYVGIPIKTFNKHGIMLGTIHHRLDVECTMYNSTVRHLNSYIDEIEKRKSKSLDRLN